MKKLYLFSGILFSSFVFSQTMIGNINSGAVSNANFMYSVGEIYVIPTDENDTNSGTMGVLYQTTLSVLGVKDLEIEGVKYYPNPTTDVVHVSLKSKIKLEEVQVFDLTGKNISNIKIVNGIINVSFLPKGIYLLKFKNTEIKPIKIIKN